MPDHDWHLDKKITLGLILAVIVQTSGGAFLAASIIKQVEVNQEEIRRLRIENAGTQILIARITKLETILERLDRTVAKLERKIDGDK